tara:strand:+ start:1291 stop:1515 length:225 start_codon:yes stop_codon:yes gene_type:complete
MIKLIWKFSGPDAKEIAKHHLSHLRQYIQKENLEVHETNYEKFDENTVISFAIVSDELLDKVKNDLKPHEGYLV